MEEGVDVEMNSPGNFNVGWTNGGEWMEYTVHVAETSRYTIKTIAASPNNNSSVRFKLDDADLTTSVVIPNTGGWQSYRTISTPGISLNAGTHILQFFEETGGFNIDKIIFEKETVMSNTATPERSAYHIYPNPATTEITVAGIDENPSFNLEIFDMKGQLIDTISHKKSGNTITTDISMINPGCYLLKIYSAKEVQTRKLIVK
jgi:hypothetical protein